MPAQAPSSTPEPAPACAAPKARALRPALAAAVRAEGAPRLLRPASAGPGPGQSAGRSPGTPALGTGRPIRPRENRDAPRRNQTALLGLDSGARTVPRYPADTRCVVPGRDLGTVEALLEVPGPRRIAAEADLEPVGAAEGSEVDGHWVDERTLGQRAWAMMTPTRVLALGALTTAVFVGSNAWLHVH